MRRALWVVLAFMAPVWAHAADDAGTASVFAVGAGNRALALGGAYTAIANDAGGWMWNPGGLGVTARGQFQFTQSAPDELEFRDSYFGIVVPSWRWGGMAATYRQFGAAGIERRDDRNLPTGELESVESEIAFGYGRAIGDGLSLGGVAKVRRQELGSFSANGVGADVGLMLRPAAFLGTSSAWTRDLTVGFSIANLVAPALMLDVEEVADPRAARLGFALRHPFGGLGSALVAFDLESVEGRSARMHGGLELSPHPLLALRVGLSGATFTAGSGIQVGPAEFDYAFENQPLASAHRFGMTFHFGASVEDARDAYVAGREAEIQERLAETFEEQQRTRVRDLIREADAALRAGDPGLAHERATLARALDPSHPEALRLEGASLLARAQEREGAGAFAEAAVAYAQVVQLIPRDSVATAGLERCRAESDRRAARTADLRGRFDAGVSAYTSGKLTEARANFEALLVVQPEDREARTMLMRVETAIARRAETLVIQANRNLSAGRRDEARRQLDEARALDPRVAGLVAAEASLDRAARAGADPTTVARPAPSALTGAERREVAQLYQRGLSAMQAGRADEAVRYWELVWQKAPDYQNVRQSLKQEYLARGMESFAAGNLNEAVQHWERALRIDPGDERARAYLTRAQEHLTKSREIGTR